MVADPGVGENTLQSLPLLTQQLLVEILSLGATGLVQATDGSVSSHSAPQLSSLYFDSTLHYMLLLSPE